MPAPGSQQQWTTRALLHWTTQYFEKKGIDSPRRSAEMLLAHVLEIDRLRLYTDADRPASELERAAFRDLVERAAKHEPVDYLVGEAPFFSMTFKVSPATLIPRPSTATIVEHILQHHRRTPGFHSPFIADVGTGSGVIAIVLAKHIKDCRVLATDLSAEALNVARANAAVHGVSDKIDFVQGDLLEPLVGKRCRYLVSNPPYIPDDEWDAVEPNVKDYEPHSALRGGPDGLKFLRPLIEQAHEYLDTPGQLVLEIAAARKKEVLALAAGNPHLEHAVVLPDHEALPRVLVAERKA